jgi:hypothetical protein
MMRRSFAFAQWSTVMAVFIALAKANESYMTINQF